MMTNLKGGVMVGVMFLGILIVLFFLPTTTLAFGKHDGLKCIGCHAIHTAKAELIFTVKPNVKAINPRTKKPFVGVTALCIACHETRENGGLGIMPVSAVHSHPYGTTVDPKVARVPEVFLRDGKLECVGCHDPHPSNPNYKYLRVDTAKGAKMDEFCALCHRMKVDPRAVKDMKIFDSMDERKFVPPVPVVVPPKK